MVLPHRGDLDDLGVNHSVHLFLRRSEYLERPFRREGLADMGADNGSHIFAEDVPPPAPSPLLRLQR